jgi:hypothetical protein
VEQLEGRALFSTTSLLLPWGLGQGTGGQAKSDLVVVKPDTLTVLAPNGANGLQVVQTVKAPNLAARLLAQFTPQEYSEPGREVQIGAPDLSLSVRESGHEDTPGALDGGSGQLVLAFGPGEEVPGQAGGLPRHLEYALELWHKEGKDYTFLVEAAGLLGELRHAPDPSLFKTSGDTPGRMEAIVLREGREHPPPPDFLGETALALLPGKLDAASLPARSEADLGRVRPALPDQPGDEDATAEGALGDASPGPDLAPAAELRLPPPQAVLAPLGQANPAVVATTVVGRPDDQGAPDAEETTTKQFPVTQFVVGLEDAPALPPSVACFERQSSHVTAQEPMVGPSVGGHLRGGWPTRDDEEEDNGPTTSIRPQPHEHVVARGPSAERAPTGEKMRGGLDRPWLRFLNGLWPRDSAETARSVLLLLNVLLAYGLWRMDKGDDALRR